MIRDQMTTHDKLRHEAAALFAVARFRNVKIGQILYGGDNLDSEAWDNRGWQRRWSIREKLVELAAEACLELTDEDAAVVPI